MTKKLSTIMAAVLLICIIISVSCIPVMAATNASNGYISFLDLAGGFHQGAEREYEFDNFEISMHAVELYNISWLPEIQCKVELGYLSRFLWIETDFNMEASKILSFFFIFTSFYIINNCLKYTI